MKKTVFVFLLTAVFSLIHAKILNVHTVEQGPVIDGNIDKIYMESDSITDFIMYEPHALEQPTDRTVVYMLQDGANLYIGFKAYTENNMPVGVLGGREDYITFYLDPFDSRSNGYYFRINLSGQITVNDDGWVLDNGNSYDASWDGVWFRKVKIHDNYYFGEMKIPLKSIRYKKGLSQWGVNFDRYILMNNELDSWIPVNEGENAMVSHYGKIINIEPMVRGYHFEVYPEGYMKTVRTQSADSVSYYNKLSGSLNLKWDITSENTLNATINPDFSQIEGDPYSLNLSQFPTFLGERRPFFVEGNNIFRMNDLGNMGQFNPLMLFYSRKVGKSIGYDAVPIEWGAKFAGKASGWNYGILSAMTNDFYQDTLLLFERRAFGVARLSKSLLNNSEMGILLSSTATGSDDYNAALGADFTYRQGYNQFILQSAYSNKNGKTGYAVNSGFSGFFFDNIMTLADFQMISDSFDVNDMGYVPWSGRTKGMITAGPYITINKYGFRNIITGPGYVLVREPGSSDYSHLFIYYIEARLYNNTGFSASLEYGPYNEMNTDYMYRSLEGSFWTAQRKYSVSFGGNYRYSYNYARSYLANNLSSWGNVYWSIIPRIAFQVNGNYWIEFNPSNGIENMIPRVRPTLNLFLTENILLSIFNETVAYANSSNMRDLEIYSNRIGMLFSWNFSPKSWVYIAVNDNMEENMISGDLERINTAAAFKIKYLFYF